MALSSTRAGSTACRTGWTTTPAVMVEPLSVGVHAALRRLPRPEEQVLVVGCGIIGLSVIQATRALSPECHLTVMARYPQQAEMAHRLGANDVVVRDDPYLATARITGGKLYSGLFNNRMILGGFDVVYDCVGSRRTVRDSLRWARAGGTVVMVGIRFEPMHVDLTPVWYQEVVLIGLYAHGMEERQGAKQSTYDLTTELLPTHGEEAHCRGIDHPSLPSGAMAYRGAHRDGQTQRGHQGGSWIPTVPRCDLPWNSRPIESVGGRRVLARAYSGKGEKVPWGIIPSLGRPLVVLLLLQLMGGMVLSPHRTFFPLYIKGLGYPVLLISALATGQQIMGLIGAWVGGGLADSLGRKGTLFLGQIGALLGSLAFLAPSVGWIAPLWLLGGLCGGLHTVAAQSYLLDSTPANTLGMFSALYNWGTTLGGALGNPVAGFLLEHQGYPTFGVVLGLLALLALATNLFFLPPSPAVRDGKAASRQKAVWIWRHRRTPDSADPGPAAFPAHGVLGYGADPDPLDAPCCRRRQRDDCSLCDGQPGTRFGGADHRRACSRPARLQGSDRGRFLGAGLQYPGHRCPARSIVERLRLRGFGHHGGLVAFDVDAQPGGPGDRSRGARARAGLDPPVVEPGHGRGVTGRRGDVSLGARVALFHRRRAEPGLHRAGVRLLSDGQCKREGATLDSSIEVIRDCR